MRGKPLVEEIKRFAGNPDTPDGAGYDHLDLLFNGIFPIDIMPEETREREPGMVFYQKTPARIMMQLAEEINLKEANVFYDLGSGLGQVSIWVHLLTGIHTRGVELEPEFYRYAKKSATDLDLKNVEFICDDARAVNYSDATIFYLYTPFTGEILDTVLDILHRESQKRRIDIFTYGPCTLQVAKQEWLRSHNERQLCQYSLFRFKSSENISI